jgi:hypothetical protein
VDLALALWYYNPAAQYTLTADSSAVAEWRSPAIPQPAAAQLQTAWATAQTDLAAQATLAATRAQHAAALATLKPTLAADATINAADIATVQRLATGMQHGAAPIQAELLPLLRFILRSLIVLDGAP